MNFIYISPNFPERYFQFVKELRARGMNVLCIGDTPYTALLPELKESATEYYWLPTLSDYEAVLNACRFFEKKYGKIDYLESNNEWWLTQDARLRKDLGITTGLLPEDMNAIKAKSAMKQAFSRAGVKTMRYVLVDGPKDLEKAKKFVEEVGYPVFVKPDVGVGASDSYSIKTEERLLEFLSKELPETYIMEEYIDGSIVSFDGCCDSNSNVVFCCTDHFPVAVAITVNEKLDNFYWNTPFELPMQDVDPVAFEKAGRAVVKSFGIKKRLFHIEFFVLKSDRPGLAKKGEFIALECNMRCPGGNTPDLMNYANSVSLHAIYADVIAYDENRQAMNLEKYYAFAVSRKDCMKYAHSHEDICNLFKSQLMVSGRYPHGISEVMGDQYYYGKFKTYEEGLKFQSYVQEYLS